MGNIEVGKSYNMYRKGENIVLTQNGNIQVEIPMECIAIRNAVWHKYYWFSPDDHFEQGSSCEVCDYTDGVWYLRNKTWEANYFRLLPDAIIGTEDIEGKPIDRLDMYVYCHNGVCRFVEPDGKFISVVYDLVKTINNKSVQGIPSDAWHSCKVSYVADMYYYVNVEYFKVPTLRDFIYATVD